MSSGRDDFRAGTTPVLKAAGFEASDDRPAVIVLVIDDSADDAITSAIARQTHIPSDQYGGAWSGQVAGGQAVAKFHVIAYEDEFERQWIVEDMDPLLMAVGAEASHYVALLPTELAGDFSDPVDVAQRAIGGGLVVEVEEPSASLAILHRHHEG
jgi:hypothetical protein